MSILTYLVDAKIDSSLQDFDAKTLTRPALLISDGLNKTFAVDLDVGQTNPMRNVPVASGAQDVLYAEVGSAVRVRKSASGWYEVVGYSKRMPGTYFQVPVTIPKFDFAPMVKYAGTPAPATTGGVIVGTPVQKGITSRVLAYDELATFGGYGIVPYGAIAIFVDGTLVEVR